MKPFANKHHPNTLPWIHCLGLGELHNRFMAKGQVEELAQVTYGVTNRAADRTSPDRGK